MSFLTVINESGIPPHSTCLFEWGDSHPKRLEWYGFFPTGVSAIPLVPDIPKVGRHLGQLAVKGRVGSDDRTQYITSYVRFEVPDYCLRLSELMIDTEWRGSTYVIGIQDCVSMSAAIAKKCGLYVPIINMTPVLLVEFLALYNTYTHYVSTVYAPHPWVPPKPAAPVEPWNRSLKDILEPEKSEIKYA